MRMLGINTCTTACDHTDMVLHREKVLDLQLMRSRHVVDLRSWFDLPVEKINNYCRIRSLSSMITCYVTALISKSDAWFSSICRFLAHSYQDRFSLRDTPLLDILE